MSAWVYTIIVKVIICYTENRFPCVNYKINKQVHSRTNINTGSGYSGELSSLMGALGIEYTVKKGKGVSRPQPGCH